MNKSWLNKEWFIFIEGKQEGPYSLLDLKRDFRFSPDTLVWKEGFSNWLAARYVPELKELFKDEPDALPIQDRFKPKSLPTNVQPEDTLTMQRDPPQFFFWVIVIIFIVIYMLFQVYVR